MPTGGRVALSHHRGFLAALAAAFLLVACGGADLQREFEEEAGRPPSGITRTDATGALIRDASGDPVQVDSTDWQAGPLYAGAIRFDPAYPNPVRSGVVTIPFVVPFSNSLAGGIRLRGFDDVGRFVLLDEVLDASLTGAWTFVFSPTALSAAGDLSSIRGLHRLFILDSRGRLVSYGDLLIE